MIPPFTLVDDDGNEYEASSRGWTVKGSIGLIESLNPGVNKSGLVVFDVPQDRNYRLKLSGGYWFLEDAYIRLSPKASGDEAVKAAEPQEKKLERHRYLERAEEAVSPPPGGSLLEYSDKLNQKIDELEKADDKADEEAAQRGFHERLKAEQEREAADQEREAAKEKAKWRTWTDSSGTKFYAKFNGMIGSTVMLIEQDRSKVKIALDDLSAEDQKWIAKRKK